MTELNAKALAAAEETFRDPSASLASAIRAYLAASPPSPKVDDAELLEIAERQVRKLLASPPYTGEPVAWRVLINDNGRRMNTYTERLPFEPLTDSGVKVLSDPEPLYIRPPLTNTNALEAERDEWKGRAENCERHCVPISKDGKSVFIDGPGDFEIDYNGWHARAEVAKAERDELRRQRDDLGKAWDSCDADRQELRAERDELRKALEPFAEQCADENENRSDDTPAFYYSKDGFDEPSSVTIGDFRRARALTERKKGGWLNAKKPAQPKLGGNV